MTRLPDEVEAARVTLPLRSLVGWLLGARDVVRGWRAPKDPEATARAQAADDATRKVTAAIERGRKAAGGG